MNKAVFIDKDGTLINDIPYNVDISLIKFCNGATDALKQLSKNGYLIIIISNQSGIAHNYFTLDELLKVRDYISFQLASHEVILNGFYYCPHHPEGKNALFTKHCNCRKPLPGMILQASKDFKINLNSSWMIGDILNDVEAGYRAGSNTILIDNGNETEWIMSKSRIPDYKAKNLWEAAGYILEH